MSNSNKFIISNYFYLILFKSFDFQKKKTILILYSLFVLN